MIVIVLPGGGSSAWAFAYLAAETVGGLKAGAREGKRLEARALSGFCSNVSFFSCRLWHGVTRPDGLDTAHGHVPRCVHGGARRGESLVVDQYGPECF